MVIYEKYLVDNYNYYIFLVSYFGQIMETFFCKLFKILYYLIIIV